MQPGRPASAGRPNTSPPVGDLRDQLRGEGSALLWRHRGHVGACARAASSSEPSAGSGARSSSDPTQISGAIATSASTDPAASWSAAGRLAPTDRRLSLVRARERLDVAAAQSVEPRPYHTSIIDDRGVCNRGNAVAIPWSQQEGTLLDLGAAKGPPRGRTRNLPFCVAGIAVSTVRPGRPRR